MTVEHERARSHLPTTSADSSQITNKEFDDTLCEISQSVIADR